VYLHEGVPFLGERAAAPQQLNRVGSELCEIPVNKIRSTEEYNSILASC